MVLEVDDDFCKYYELSVSYMVHEYQRFQLHLGKKEQDCIMSMVKEHRKLFFVIDKLTHCDYIQAKTLINKI